MTEASTPPDRVIGFIGVGDMGGPMARNLVAAGWHVVVYDVDVNRTQPLAQAGAQIAASARAVADTAPVVFACLNSVEAMRAVAAEVAGGFAVKVYADLSTAGPDLAVELRQYFSRSRAQMLDAPISGQVNRAEDGTLAIMVSGEESAFGKAKPAFDVIGAHVFYLGNVPGGGQMMKVANNLINLVQTIATSEALLMGTKFGLGAEQMFEVLNASTGRNSQTDGQLRRAVLEDNFSLGADMSITKKDIALAISAARDAGVFTPTADAAQAAVNEAYASGEPGQRSSAIFKYIAAKSGQQTS